MQDTDYLSFIKKREDLQNETASLFSKLTNKEYLFIESPTGSGKTHICIKSSIAKQNVSQTPIIISTNSNANAKNVRETARNYYNLSENDIVMEIGRSSYINITLFASELKKDKELCLFVTHNELVEKYFIEERNEEQLFNSEILLEDFCEELGIREEDFYFLPFMQSSGDEVGEKELASIIKHLQSNKIIVTNHSYFIILTQYFTSQRNKALDRETRDLFINSPIILDEFHTIHDSAKSILSNNFSLFQLKNSLSSVLKHCSPKGNTTVLKKISSLLSKTITIQEKLADHNETEMVKIAKSEINVLKVDLGYSKGIEAFTKQIRKIKNNTNDMNLSMAIARTTKELTELKLIPTTSSKMQIEFSPKQYPSFLLINSVPMYQLKSRVFSRLNGSLMGLSGTMRTGTEDTKNSYEWVLQRNGFYKEDKDEFNKFLATRKLEPERVAEILQEEQIFRDSLDSMKFKKYNSLFKKSNFQFVIFKDELLAPPKYEYNAADNYKDDWYNTITTIIANTISCNSLVLVSSYEDVDNIANKLKTERGDIKIAEAKRGITLTSTIKQHKQNIENGYISCIVGSEQYFTGLDLKGDYLKEVFLVKLPFEPPKNNVGEHKYNSFDFTKSENYSYKLLFKVLQGVGRGNRDFLDKTILYLLDPRIYNNIQTSKIISFMKEKGIEISHKSALKNKPSFLNCSSNFNYIYLLFKEVFPNMSIKKIIENIQLNPSELEHGNRSIKKLLDMDYDLNKYGLEESRANIEHPNYNFWKFLLKVYLSCSLEYDNVDNTQKVIEESNGDLIAYAKRFF